MHLLLGLALAGTAPAGSPWPDVAYFHPTLIGSKKVTEPVYPEVDEADQRTRHRCMVWVRINPDGIPTDTQILADFPGDGCSEPFQKAAVESVAQRTWKPTKIGKEKAEVHTQIPVVFWALPSEPLIDTSLAGSPLPAPVPQPKKSIYGDPKTLPAPGSTPAPKPRPAEEAPVEPPAEEAPTETPAP